jgi:diguanylate cyclase (GGDEF)-like protein
MLNNIAQEIGLTPEEIAQRKQFLEFSETDIQLLMQLHRYIADHAVDDFFTESFYSHLFSFPALKKFLPDEATIHRLKMAQSKYFKRLTQGEYGDDYVLDRLRVGYVHQKIGLEPKWYTGAYRKYLSSLMPVLHEMSKNDNEKFMSTFDALLKVVFFDMELALDTYFHGNSQELLRMANHDALTGLPNRNLLHDRLAQAIHFADRVQGKIAFLFIDLDRLKTINDSLGHSIGDKIITEVSLRIPQCLRERDTVARLGGDEFVVVLFDVEKEEYVAQVAEKILRSIEKSITLEAQEFFVSGSMGIAIYPEDGKNQDELLKNADTAMYQAKQAGRNAFRFYRREMNTLSLGRLNMETQLRRALEKGEFLLHYQPQVDLTNGRIVGAEALLRWKSRDGLISPAEFIPLAEETGLIVPIGEWVLEAACLQAVAWYQAGASSIRVAVNLSARQFVQQDMVEMVTRTLQKTRCSPHWLELEITESIIMARPEEAATTLKILAGMGIAISIDDFGTGYSSLAYLKRFPIHSLKIDRSFVLDIATDPDDASIVHAVIALAHSLNLQVVAEGVEDDAQLKFLREHGCDLVQGYYFYRPQLPDEVLRKILSAPVSK